MQILGDGFFESRYRQFIVLILPSLLLYWKTFGFGFSPLDEQWMIVDNTWFLSDWSNLTKAFTGPTSLLIYYRPLFVLSTFLDYHTGGLDPHSYRVTNLLLHVACVVLLYKFLVQCKAGNRTAFWLSLMFSLHPVMVHAVAWIPGRNDSMLCMFILAALICLNRFFINHHKLSYAFHILFYTCALLTKETAFLLPIIFFGFTLAVQKAGGRTLLVNSAVWLLIGAGWFMLRNSLVGYVPRSGLSSGTFLENVFYGFILNAGKTLLPFDQAVFPVIKAAHSFLES
jgi:protein O-mannosyl-transferase